MLNDISSIIEIAMSVIGFVLAFFLYFREKRNAKIRHLAKQVYGFYITEQYYLNALAEKNKLLNQNGIKQESLSSESTTTLKKEVRKMAKTDSDFPQDTVLKETSYSIEKDYLSLF